jgi:PAN domain-containing protein
MSRLTLWSILAFAALLPARVSAQNVSEEFGFDRRGDDYDRFQARSLDDCQRQCRRDDRCRAYTYLRTSHDCYLKDRVNSAQRNGDAVTGTKSGDETGSPGRPYSGRGVTEETNLDRPGNDYDSFRARDLDDCKRACARDGRCRAYTFYYTDRTCYLKDRVGGTRYNRHTASGVKLRGRGGYPDDGYPGGGWLTEEPDADHPGNDYHSGRVADAQACKRLCADDPRCRAYTFYYKSRACYLKDRVNRGEYRRGAVTGVKRGG